MDKNSKENKPLNSKKSSKKSLNEKFIDKYSISTFDIWPSCATKRNASENQIFFEKHKLRVLDEATSKFPKDIPKPVLLKYLENYLANQLHKHNIKEDDENPVRLQIYREIFDWLIESFKTYQPLLSKIKREYEINISLLKEEIRRLEPMKEMLWTITEDRDQQIVSLKKIENKEIAKLKQEKNEILEKLSEHEANNVTLQFEVNELSRALKQEHEAYRKEFDARKLLIMDINELKTQFDDLAEMKKDKEAAEEEDPVMLRLALEQAKKAHAEAVKEVSDTRAIFANSMPRSKFIILDNKYNILLIEYKSVSDKLVNIESQYKSLDEKYNALNQQRDFYYLKYMELAKSTGPSTMLMDKFHDVGGVERWQTLAGKGHTQAELAQTILDDLKEEAAVKSKEILDSAEVTSTSSLSDHAGEGRKTRSHSKRKSVSKDSKAVMRTMIEMLCDLPPGTLNPSFDPLSLLPILTKEETVKDTHTKSKTRKSVII